MEEKAKTLKGAKVNNSDIELLVKKEPYVGFLRNETVIVQFIPKPTKEITDTKHIAYGGKLQGSFDYISPPRLRKDSLQNVLTKEEKEGLEFLMGRDLSIYSDFWRGYRKGGMFPIALGKDDIHLNLSVPEHYITWKVLLNTDLVANSIDDLKNKYKASYKYVMVKENEGAKQEEELINEKAKAYEFFSKISSSKDSLRYVLRLLGKHTHANQELSFLVKELGKAIENPKERQVILKASQDKLIKEKILLEEAFALGVIERMNGQYFSKEGEAISETGVEPNEDNAAKFLGSPVGQETKLSIEARVKNAREL